MRLNFSEVTPQSATCRKALTWDPVERVKQAPFREEGEADDGIGAGSNHAKQSPFCCLQSSAGVRPACNMRKTAVLQQRGGERAGRLEQKAEDNHGNNLRLCRLPADPAGAQYDRRRAAARDPYRQYVVFARFHNQAAELTHPGTRWRVDPNFVAPDHAPGDQAIRCFWRKPCSQSGKLSA